MQKLNLRFKQDKHFRQKQKMTNRNLLSIKKIASSIVLFLLLFTLSSSQFTTQCHYSCYNCTASQYTKCFSCSDQSNTFTVLQKPDQIDPLYRNSIYDSGICTGKVSEKANGLGIVLLIISIGGLLITQSFQAFFIISTFQTLGLFDILEVAWLSSSSFILQSFQYFMPINLMVGPSKTKDSNLLKFGFYRLDKYMLSSENSGLIAIFSIDCVLFIAIVLIFAFTFLRRKREKNADQRYMRDELIEKQRQANGNNLVPQFSTKSEKELYKKKEIQGNGLNNVKDLGQQQKSQPMNRVFQVFCDRITQCLVLRKVLHIIIYVFFFFIQQTALSIMVGAVFDIDLLDIAIWIIYFIQLITVLIIAYYELEVDKQMNPRQKKTHQFGLSLFLSRQCMFLIIIKKLLLPLGVVLPANLQFVYFIIYLIIFFIEGTLDSRSKRIKCLSRMTLWKVFELIITILLLSFYFNEKKGTTVTNANLINTILTIVLVIFILSLFVEFTISFIGLFCSDWKIGNDIDAKEARNKNLFQLNNTELTLNQVQKGDNNIFETIQLTRQNTDQKQLRNKHQSPSQNTQPEKIMRIQQISDIEHEPQHPRKQSDLVISKSKTNERTSIPYQQPEIQKKIIENPSKVTKTQIQAKEEIPIIPKNQIQMNDNIDIDEKYDHNKEQEQEENDFNKVKAKQRKRIQDAELRKRYGLK